MFVQAGAVVYVSIRYRLVLQELLTRGCFDYRQANIYRADDKVSFTLREVAYETDVMPWK